MCGFPRWLSGKEASCQCRKRRSIPGLGGSPGEEKGNLLQHSCLGAPMDRGAWRAAVHGAEKSGTQLSPWAHILASQSSVSSCYATSRISCMYAHIPSHLDIRPTPPHPTSIPAFQVVTERQAQLPARQSRFPLAVSFTHGSVYTAVPISRFMPPPPPFPHIHSLHLHLCSCPANRFICPVSLDSIYMH